LYRPAAERKIQRPRLAIDFLQMAQNWGGWIQERYRWMDELTSKLSAAEQIKINEALTLLTEAARQLEQQETV
jgi:hypothetical protein